MHICILDIPTRNNRSLHRTNIRHWRDAYNENNKEIGRPYKTKSDIPFLVPLCYIGVGFFGGLAITLLVMCCFGLLIKVETRSMSYKQAQHSKSDV